MWWEVITDALLDTLKLFPFLFLLYILVELMEHNTKIGKPNGALSGRFAPLIGAATGLVPMCGFSVMAAKLYRNRYLTLGTLLSVFIATNDEAFIVLLLSDLGWLNKLVSLLSLCGCKIVLGALVGYLADLIAARRVPPVRALPEHACAEPHVHEHAHDEKEDEKEENHAHVHEDADASAHIHTNHGHDEYSVCEHKHGKESNLSLYLVAPLLHAFKIAAFILAVNLAFGFLFFGIGGGDAEGGQARVIEFLHGAGFWYQPLVCCLVGMIPNCASSVVLAETYALGGIAFGSLFAGLAVNAGLGYIVLLRDYKKWRETALIALVMFAVGLAAGYCVNAIGLFVPAIG